MNFRPELAEKVMRGEKTVTRRLVSDNPRSPWWWERCGLVVGRDYAVCPGRGKPALGRIRVLCVEQMLLGRIDAIEAEWEGFGAPQEFEEAFAGINGTYDPAALVWRIEFAALSEERP